MSQTNATIGLEEGWKEIYEKGIEPLQEYVQNGSIFNDQELFTRQQYSHIYT